MTSTFLPCWAAGIASSAGIICTAANAPTADTNPLASQSVDQFCPAAFNIETNTADTAIPTPTPANRTALKSSRPRLIMKSSNNALVNTVITLLRATQYSGLDSFSQVGDFVPLTVDPTGAVLQEVAPAQFSLTRPEPAASNAPAK